MKEGFFKKVELVANLCIILAALLGIFALSKYLVFGNGNASMGQQRAAEKQPTKSPQKFVPAIGTKISLPGVSWRNGQKTILMVLSTTVVPR